MIECKACGKEIEEQSKFCPFCGAKQTKEPIKIDTDNTEESAKKEFDIKNIFNAGTPKENVINLAKFCLCFAKDHKKQLVLVIIAIVVIAIGAGIYSATHCQRSGCNNSVVSGSKYCYSHKCDLCDGSKFLGSNYCYSHYKLYDDDAKTVYSNASSDLKFSNIQITHNSSYTVVTGKVTNYGSRTYKFVTIKGSFKNSSGTVLDTDSTYAVGSEGLAPSESTTFRMSVDRDYTISKCDISITDYS